MDFSNLIDALNNIGSSLMANHANGQDIVDHLGRHHEPKGIETGGQYENEAAYATSAKAAKEYYHKKFAHTDGAKKMREVCSELISHIDSSKMGNDTIRHPYEMAINNFKKMSKQSILDGANKQYEEMKKHSGVYQEIKDMNKEDFTKWVKDHPEYHSGQMDNLLTNPAYNGKRKIKNANGEYEEQDHEAWEEAKFMVGRKAIASMMMYMAHIEALNNTPDEMIKNYLDGKGASEKHKKGYVDFKKNHKLEHGTEKYDAESNPTQSEINAVESELSRAWEVAKDDDPKKKEHATMVAHALSHFLGKDGGMRDPKVSKGALLGKIGNRIEEKKAKLEEAKKDGDKEKIAKAEADHQASLLAGVLVAHAIGYETEQGTAGLKEAEAEAKKLGLQYEIGYEDEEPAPTGKENKPKDGENKPKNAEGGENELTGEHKEAFEFYQQKGFNKLNATSGHFADKYGLDHQAVKDMMTDYIKKNKDAFVVEKIKVSGKIGSVSLTQKSIDDIENKCKEMAANKNKGGEGAKSQEPKNELSDDEAKKIKGDIKAFLDTPHGKKAQELVSKYLDASESKDLDAKLAENNISKNLSLAQSFIANVNKAKETGNKDEGKKNYAKYLKVISYVNGQFGE